jgi:predicted outer membrane protein
MPQGDKSAYTAKQKRQARDIEKGYEDRGVAEKESARRAWATVNKLSGGGLKGRKTTTAKRAGGRRAASAKKATSSRKTARANREESIMRNPVTKGRPWVHICFAAAVACSPAVFAPAVLADSGDHDVSGDEAFITVMEQAGLSEIELSRIAVDSATSAPEIRNFAARMIAEHAANDAELDEIAANQNIALPFAPDSDHMQLRDQLIALRGRELDKTYMEVMRNDHQKMVDFLSAASSTVASDELRNYIKKTLPMAQRHLRMAQELETG